MRRFSINIKFVFDDSHVNPELPDSEVLQLMERWYTELIKKDIAGAMQFVSLEVEAKEV